jgi:hypothetical protein
MSYGQAGLNALLLDSSITALLTGGTSGVFCDTAIPQYYPDKTKVGPADAVILYYRVNPVNRGLDYLETDYSVSCYASTKKLAEDIADAVTAVVNRYYSDGTTYRVTALRVIPQPTRADGYNAPLEIHVWSRTFD